MNTGIRSRIVLLASALTAVALAVSACAPAAAPLHTKAPGVHQHAAPPSPTPTPTPTVPVALVGATCAQLGSLTLLDKVFAHPVTVRPFANIAADDIPTANFDVIAPLQLGGLECFWADGPYTILPDSELTIEVLPNAGAAFTAATPDLAKTDDATTGFAKVVPKWGDASYSNCGAQMGECIFDILVGDYWLHIDEINSETPAAPYPQDAAQKALLTAAVASIKALPPAAASWTPPGDAANLPTTCASALTVAQVKSAFGITTAPTPSVGSGLTTFDASANSAAGLLTCNWSPNPNYPQLGLTLDILPGSSWAWSSTAPPSTPADHLSAIAGVNDELWGGCQTGVVQCSVYGQVDHSWFDVTLDSKSATLAKVEGLASDVIAAT
jgi:hypothetical protein